MALTKIDGARQLRFTGDMSMQSNKITGLAAPTNVDDAACKSYVDSVAQGLSAKDSVQAATTAAGTLSTDFDNDKTLDGVTLATGDRILIKNQADASENGVYIVVADGAPTRALDMDATGEVSGSYFFVKEGTTNADSGWVCTTNGEVVVGTDDINFSQFSGAGSISAGTGLTKSGNTIDLASSNAGIAINADDITLTTTGSTLGIDGSGIKVADDGITETQLNTSIAGDGLSGGGGSALSINVDDSSIETNADSLRIKALGVTNAMLAGSIAVGKMSLTDANFMMGNGSNVGAEVQMSGDATMTNAGVVSLNPEFGVHKMCDVASTANISDLASGAPDTVDGISLSTNDRVLVKDQTSADENGIYQVDTVGSGSNGAWSRVSDFDSSSEVMSGASVMVKYGTANQATLWAVDSNDTSITVDTDNIPFKLVGIEPNSVSETHLTTSVAGDGLAGGNGTSLSVNVDDSSIEIDSDTLRVKASGITNAMLAGSIAAGKLTLTEGYVFTGASGDVGQATQLTSGQFLLGNGSDIATAVSMSGDATMSSTGAVTIGSDAVDGQKLDLRKEVTSGALGSEEWTLSAAPYDDDHLFLFRNGQALHETDDYTRSGAVITFVDETQATDKFMTLYMV